MDKKQKLWLIRDASDKQYSLGTMYTYNAVHSRNNFLLRPVDVPRYSILNCAELGIGPACYKAMGVKY